MNPSPPPSQIDTLPHVETLTVRAFRLEPGGNRGIYSLDGERLPTEPIQVRGPCEAGWGEVGGGTPALLLVPRTVVTVCAQQFGRYCFPRCCRSRL